AERMEPDSVYVPSEGELSRIEEIANERFRAERVNLSAKSPRFDFEKVCTFSGGSIIFAFTVKGGVIADASVRGDFFTDSSVETLEKALEGIAFTASAVSEAVKGSGFSAMGITVDAIAEKLSEGIA
ncbi:MAG: hypothetical protein IKW68_05485, partial [Clostridia bacterium]|nr:hypothetical protein [Clostridia bacterium]